MTEVALVPPKRELLRALARVVSTQPVDPPGLNDHAWLLGDPERVLNAMRRSLAHCATHGGGGWIVLADGVPVGLITLKVVDGEAETFTFVCKEAQNQGVATAARAGLAVHVRAKPEVQRLISTARAGSPSSKVSQRLGYERVGSEVRPHPQDGSDVLLERYELSPRRWVCPEEVHPARLDR